MSLHAAPAAAAGLSVGVGSLAEATAGLSLRPASASPLATPTMQDAPGTNVHAVAPVRDAALVAQLQAADNKRTPRASPTTSPSLGPSPSPSPDPPLDAAAVRSMLRTSFPLWQHPSIAQLDDAKIDVRRLPGGSSNFLWLCRVTPEGCQQLEATAADAHLPPLSLVVRFYGQSLDTLIERTSEAEVAEQLSLAGIGARILHQFDQPAPGRIEQFIPGRTLKYDEIGKEEIARPLAEELAKLHCTQLPRYTEPAAEDGASASAAAPSPASPRSPLPVEPIVFESLAKYFKVALTARAAVPGSFSSFDPSSDAARNDPFSADAQNELAARLGMPDIGSLLAADGSWTLERIDALDLMGDVEELPSFIRDNKIYREVRWLSELLANWNALTYAHDSREPDAKVVEAQRKLQDDPSHQKFLRECVAFGQTGLCHNDLNPGNIMYRESANHEDADSVSATSAAATTFTSSGSPIPPPDAFTLIDFEYAAPNLPACDLANHLCERSLNYTVPHWPFFASTHQRSFPTQEAMMNFVQWYCEAKSKIKSPHLRCTPHSLAHLYVSTLTGMLASHLLWSLWSVIQSAGVRPSTREHPSWTVQAHSTGRPFALPPLGFLEYAEQRMELYMSLKRLWLHHSHIREPFPPPPRWQALRASDDWRVWMEQLDYLHDDMKRIELKSHARQQEALRRYVEGYKQRDQPLPWPMP